MYGMEDFIFVVVRKFYAGKDRKILGRVTMVLLIHIRILLKQTKGIKRVINALKMWKKILGW